MWLFLLEVGSIFFGLTSTLCLMIALYLRANHPWRLSAFSVRSRCRFVLRDDAGIGLHHTAKRRQPRYGIAQNCYRRQTAGLQLC